MPRSKGQHGTVRKKRIYGTWWWVGGWHPIVDGKRSTARERLGKCAGMTKAEAKDALREIIREYENRGSDSPTVAELFTRIYIPARFGKWSKNSRNAYVGLNYPNKLGGCVGKHILPALGHIEVASLTKGNIEALIQRMATEGYGHESLKRVRDKLQEALWEAVDRGIIDRNPIRKLDLPVKRPRQGGTLSWDQVQRIFAGTDGLTHLMLRLLIQCGLRLGECLALRWNDIEPNRIRIDEQWTCSELKDEGKTAGSIATVPLPGSLYRALVAWRSGKFAMDDDWVFPGRADMPLGATTARKWLAAAGDAAGVPGLNMRVCRRTFGTLMQQRLTPRDLAGVMRHSDPATSLRAYANALTGEQAAAVEALDAELNTEGGSVQ